MNLKIFTFDSLNLTVAWKISYIQYIMSFFINYFSKKVFFVNCPLLFIAEKETIDGHQGSKASPSSGSELLNIILLVKSKHFNILYNFYYFSSLNFFMRPNEFLNFTSNMIM